MKLTAYLYQTVRQTRVNWVKVARDVRRGGPVAVCYLAEVPAYECTRYGAAQSAFILAALKAKKLSDAQLVAAIQHYQTTEKQHVAGACRVERHQRTQAAVADQVLRDVFA